MLPDHFPEAFKRGYRSTGPGPCYKLIDQFTKMTQDAKLMATKRVLLYKINIIWVCININNHTKRLESIALCLSFRSLVSIMKSLFQIVYLPSTILKIFAVLFRGWMGECTRGELTGIIKALGQNITHSGYFETGKIYFLFHYFLIVA